jgi:Na+-translocating ferredoxin:NAD+ oxidoreductase RnfD subunit
MSLESPSVDKMQQAPRSDAAPVPVPPFWHKLLSFDNRFLAPILITCILAVGQREYGFLISYWFTGLAILCSIAMELVLGKLVTGKWPHLASAYISGISVGIIVRSEYLWPFLVCSALSIVSKYAIRVRGRHLWNPSNLGISVLLLFADQYMYPLSNQAGNEWGPAIIIWVLGSLILYRLGRLHITLSYAAAFALLALVRSAVTGDSWLAEVAPITAVVYQLFMFFMITDPKTTTKRFWSQCAVAVLVAVAEAALRLCDQIDAPYHILKILAIHAPYFALFIVGPATNLIEIWWDARHPRPTPALKPA